VVGGFVAVVVVVVVDVVVVAVFVVVERIVGVANVKEILFDIVLIVVEAGESVTFLDLIDLLAVRVPFPVFPKKPGKNIANVVL